uniref:Uncharacterized protein n=1 Tax=Siphoviridae sp. ctD3x5 TaxID=2825384 RepID=A0A8S5Q017_9CAUD|nr:MAG TPA: hypothetical protein [Siphoviridae sp. ctD3x5]
MHIAPAVIGMGLSIFHGVLLSFAVCILIQDWN